MSLGEAWLAQRGGVQTERKADADAARMLGERRS